ncbi:MAG: hypothetical protein KC417_13795 [Myxococcales bacterium]|nr:hypothetical protein [Myxococcales bacterium]
MKQNLVWTTVLLCSACHGAESEVRTKAEFLCKYGQLDSVVTEAVPSDTKLEEYVRTEDLEFAAKSENATEGNPFAALGEAMKAGLVPALAASAEALAPNTKCEITSLQLKDKTATVSLRRTRPTFDINLAKLGSLNKLKTHEERVAEVRKWIAESKSTNTSTHKMDFAKTDAGWRADLHLKAKAEGAEKAGKLHEESVERFQAGDYKAAHEKLKEAMALAPDADWAEDMAKVEQALKQLVAGKWSKVVNEDPMEDTVMTAVSLPSENAVGEGLLAKYAFLNVVCSDGEITVAVFLNSLVDSDYRTHRVAGRYRFDKEPAESAEMYALQSRQGVLLVDPARWLAEISKRPKASLVFEIAKFNERAIVEFDLTGAKEALGVIAKACPALPQE